MNLLQEISKLPDDIIRIIKEFIPQYKLVFVNSHFYHLYHSYIRNTIPLYENYIRDTIRRDNEFVFKKIVEENVDGWVKNKNYIYKNMVFSNYIYFINYFCMENNSQNCRQNLYNYLNKRELSINLHKKNSIKYIKWTK
jgi:hypothetical protein